MDLIISQTTARAAVNAAQAVKAVQPKNPVVFIASTAPLEKPATAEADFNRPFNDLARNAQKQNVEYRVNGRSFSVDVTGLSEKEAAAKVGDAFAAELSKDFTWIESDAERCQLGRHLACYLQNPGIPSLLVNAINFGTVDNLGKADKIAATTNAREIIDIRTSYGKVTVNTHISYDHYTKGTTHIFPEGEGSPPHPVMTIDSSFTLNVRTGSLSKEKGKFFSIDPVFAGAIIETQDPELHETVRGESQSIWEKFVELVRILFNSPYLTVHHASQTDVDALRAWRQGLTDIKDVAHSPTTMRDILRTSRGFMLEKVEGVLLEKATTSPQTLPAAVTRPVVAEHVPMVSSDVNREISAILVEPGSGFSTPLEGQSDPVPVQAEAALETEKIFEPNTNSRKPVKPVILQTALPEIVVAPPPGKKNNDLSGSALVSSSANAVQGKHKADRGMTGQFKLVGSMLGFV